MLLIWVVTLLILAMVVASTWLVGLWNNFITLIILIISGLVASSFFENMAEYLEPSMEDKTYMLDFVSLWVIFLLTFVVLRVLTDALTRVRLKFHPVVEAIGRSILSIWIALVFFCFTAFTLHTAPLPIDGAVGEAFQPTPDTYNFGFGPDRMWLALIQSRSRGALAEFQAGPSLPPYDLPLHSDDDEMDARVFDPFGEFILKYRFRRELLSQEESITVRRPTERE